MMFQIHPPWLRPTSQELAKSPTNQRRQFEPKGYRPLDGFCHLQCGVLGVSTYGIGGRAGGQFISKPTHPTATAQADDDYDPDYSCAHVSYLVQASNPHKKIDTL